MQLKPHTYNYNISIGITIIMANYIFLELKKILQNEKCTFVIYTSIITFIHLFLDRCELVDVEVCFITFITHFDYQKKYKQTMNSMKIENHFFYHQLRTTNVKCTEERRDGYCFLCFLLSIIKISFF